jgi:hypothetical protein
LIQVLKICSKFWICLIALLLPIMQFGQTHSSLIVEANLDKKTLRIEQEITYFNSSNDTLTSIVLNDWNNAFSDKNTPLAKRFSDEFYRGFHLAKSFERGSTNNLIILNTDGNLFSWQRTIRNPDFVVVQLEDKLAPKQKVVLKLTYTTKVPSDKFTKYGYNSKGMSLKNWYLTPARFENHAFVTNNNDNLDDIANAVSDFDIKLRIPKNFSIATDLESETYAEDEQFVTYNLSGKNRTDFNLVLESKPSFKSFKNNNLEVFTNLESKKLTDIEKAILVNKIANFTQDLIGKYPHSKILISQADYDRNPFYGLNQLPSFLRPFSDAFIFEIQFLKTYLNSYLKTSLQLDPRKDNWIYDGIQMYAMMKYIDENHPDSKMFGSVAKYKLLKSFNLINLDFNDQYSYFYMLMARKNLDQPLGNAKNTLIKFNEQIANKYKSGLSFRYLDSYLENDFMTKSIREFYTLNNQKQVNQNDFESLLKSNTTKNIDWFFETIVNSRKIIDYKFSNVSKTKDSVTFSIKNKTDVQVPVPVFGLKKGNIVFKKWIDAQNIDSTFTWDRKNADKIVLNYKNEVPEFNLRNNWKSLQGFFPNNRPVKFAFMKDLEDPYYNQILYVPTVGYNLYDGITLGLRFHNRTVLDKPLYYDVNPSYSTNAKTVSGSASFAVITNYRDSNLYRTSYAISGSYFHYVPDATYLKINPSVTLLIRPENFRDNRKEAFVFREVLVNKGESAFVTPSSNDNYAVFNAKYYNTKTEVTNHFHFVSEVQFSNNFGKIINEIGYRKLFENNRQINLRLYAGSFLYNKTSSDYFSFALNRPTDYLFDYDYFGRSESSGLFSQQFIMAEGGFKSKLDTPFANQWLTAFNASYSVWNWIEVYGDLGLLKAENKSEKLFYDSGIRLNLVTDYFELYFPVYSNNGWEIAQNQYPEKIRFVVTLSPQTLLNLFNRKWF